MVRKDTFRSQAVPKPSCLYTGLRIVTAPGASIVFWCVCDELDTAADSELSSACHSRSYAAKASTALFQHIPNLLRSVRKDETDVVHAACFAQQCPSTLENDGHIAWNTSRHGDRRMFHATINSQTSTPLLRVLVKATFANSEWNDALVAAANLTVSRVEVYRVICERLEIGVECFHDMISELGAETIKLHDEHVDWALDFEQRAPEKLECLGDKALDNQRYDDTITLYSIALSLISSPPQAVLIKRSKA
ncbi:hypothetical protein JVT61DRAFT_6164 [Boletus reticuloceps]|uniref:Uncharacterized protein n=1 Tax=Boletus reticuloceps TaxID=495285 RepID=A0A8I3A6I0_9AGAM|nr:hypothetical protein JVT61DRAFT_6164 [Boletus reticuloceps]